MPASTENIALYKSLLARFPDLETAPSGEMPLAWGGNLEPLTLLAAYSRGFFPWFNEGDPILWWSPDPRCVLLPRNFHLPRRSRRYLGKLDFQITFDRDFARVIRECAQKRRDQDGTWITKDIIFAYTRLHEAGYAHSVETWQNGRLAGGLYGLALGKAFFGESMFHLASEASRAALACLVQKLIEKDFALIDCQQESSHMLAVGAEMLPRKCFLQLLDNALENGEGLPLATSLGI